MRISLLAGESKKVSVAGSRFYFESGMGSIRVKTIGTDVVEHDLKPGMGFQNKPDQANFSAVDIKNNDQFDQNIDIHISYKEVFDNRAVGVVSVVNSDKSRVDLGGAFVNAGNRAAAAALFSCVNLRNPVGSQKYIYVNQVVVSVPANSDCLVYLSPTIEADQVVAGVSSLSQGGVASAVGKRVNASMLGGNGRVDTFLTDGFPKGGMRPITRAYISAYSSFVFRFTEPVRLDPGAGMIAANFTANSFVSASFEFFEEAI